MDKLSSSRSMLAIVTLAAAALAGCQGGAESVDSATQLLSTDGAAAVSSNDQSTIALTDETFDVVASPDPEAATSALLTAQILPIDGKCRKRIRDLSEPHTIIITLNECPGRFGRHVVSGTEIVRFSQGEGGVLHADFQSQGLTFDGRPATHTASADITFDGAGRHVVWQGAFDTTSDKGEAIAHASDLTIDVDPTQHCRTRNGSATTTIGGREIQTSIQDLRTCRDADGDAGCPSGTVVHTREPSGKEVTVSFDGSDQATITTPRGATFEATLACHE
jgi:hypothetical protein